ncbi:LPP20 family lipoprotein [Vibrio cortegadensis]|uniref:LPP20 family lipoprotein n=1 Tax=Vibrio cortegadensis TaxID=1328770 RepID=UPI0021C3154F|nr:LPP20 family lipoprotein [Vibrio cortegadensis]MDN3697327.1 LPP20 family lipoprotein [Vibrio cortegadensis]
MKKLLLTLSLIPQIAFAVPSWVNNPPTEPEAITGTGMGESIEAAKKDAMRQIASTLSSTVTSSVSHSISTKNSQSQISSSSYANYISKSILIPEISWIKQGSDNDIFYVLGVVKKSDIIEKYDNHLTTKMKNYRNLLIKNELDLNEFLEISQGQEFKTTLLQAETISQYSDKLNTYYNELLTLIDKKNDFKNSHCFNIKNSPNSGYEKKILTPAIAEEMSKSGLSVRSDSQCETISFESSTVSGKKNGKRQAIITFNLHIGSPSLANRKFKLIGQSNKTKKQAMYNAINKFNLYFDNKNDLLDTLISEDDREVLIK